MYILKYIYQGTVANVGDSFAPLGPPLLPWENRIESGQDTYTGQTSGLLDRIGPVGQFGENWDFSVFRHKLFLPTLNAYWIEYVFKVMFGKVQSIKVKFYKVQFYKVKYSEVKISKVQ